VRRTASLGEAAGSPPPAGFMACLAEKLQILEGTDGTDLAKA